MQLHQELGLLTGAELYHLITELDKGLTQSDRAFVRSADWPDRQKSYAGLITDLLDVKLAALAQLARFDLPLIEASAIVNRARARARRPLPVPGT